MLSECTLYERSKYTTLLCTVNTTHRPRGCSSAPRESQDPPGCGRGGRRATRRHTCSSTSGLARPLTSRSRVHASRDAGEGCHMRIVYRLQRVTMRRASDSGAAALHAPPRAQSASASHVEGERRAARGGGGGGDLSLAVELRSGEMRTEGGYRGAAAAVRGGRADMTSDTIHGNCQQQGVSSAPPRAHLLGGHRLIMVERKAPLCARQGALHWVACARSRRSSSRAPSNRALDSAACNHRPSYASPGKVSPRSAS